MKKVSAKNVNQFVRACHDAADRGLVRCSSGNLSMRVAGNRLLIKASRSWIGRMTREDVSLCAIANGTLIEGRKPSVEFRFHAGIMRARPDVNVVFHFQTPCATALACRGPRPIGYFVIPEIPFYIGPIARIPYFAPGSENLARAVTSAMLKHDLVQMGNHGQVTVARDIDHAIQNAVFFELACEIILRSGNAARQLPRAETRELLRLRAAAAGGV